MGTDDRGLSVSIAGAQDISARTGRSDGLCSTPPRAAPSTTSRRRTCVSAGLPSRRSERCGVGSGSNARAPATLAACVHSTRQGRAAIHAVISRAGAAASQPGRARFGVAANAALHTQTTKMSGSIAIKDCISVKTADDITHKENSFLVQVRRCPSCVLGGAVASTQLTQQTRVRWRRSGDSGGAPLTRHVSSLPGGRPHLLLHRGHARGQNGLD